MTLREADVGISEFLGTHEEFHAILKQQLDDFIVNEIQPDGTVTCQNSRGFPGPTRTEVVDKGNANGAEEAVEKKEDELVATEPDFAVIDEMFPAASPSPSDEIKQLLESDEADYTFPPLADKVSRTAIHKWVKAHLSSFVSDTVDAPDDGGKAVRVRKRTQLRPWKRRRRGDAPDAAADASRSDTYDPRDSRGAMKRAERAGNDPFFVDRKTYVSMTLWKKGRDTNDALSCVASALRINQNNLTHAGTKDKRGVTTQMVRLRGISIRRLVSVNNASGMFHRGRRCVALGDFKVLSGEDNRPLVLGDLTGNRFTLVLRDVSVSTPAEKANILAGIESLRNSGFVNYYGLQRFGKGVSPTHVTGYAVLRADFKEACMRILTPLTIAAVAVEGEDTALRPGRRRMEEALREFGEGACSAKELFGSLPKWMTIERTIAGSLADDEEAGRALDYKVAFRKLPRNMRKMYCHAVQSYLWNCMASKRVAMHPPKSDGRQFAITGDLVPVDDTASSFNYATEVRQVTEAEENAHSVPIEKVVLPIVGSHVKAPATVPGSVATEILEGEKVDMTTLPSDYDLKGTYRRLICKPGDLEFSFKSYAADDRRALVSSKDIQMQLAVHDNAESSDPKISENASSEAVEPEQDDANLRALVISFSLGFSSYATMLTRELTRSDSSSTNQKEMQNKATP